MSAQGDNIHQYKKNLKAIHQKLLANSQYLATLSRSLMRTEIDETMSDSYIVDLVKENLIDMTDDLDNLIDATFIEEILE